MKNSPARETTTANKEAHEWGSIYRLYGDGFVVEKSMYSAASNCLAYLGTKGTLASLHIHAQIEQ